MVKKGKKKKKQQSEDASEETSERQQTSEQQPTPHPSPSSISSQQKPGSSKRQRHESVTKDPQPQIPQDKPHQQQQVPQSQPQQQIPRSQPQQHLGARGQPQQGAWGQPQQGAWGQPQQGAWAKPQQQVPQHQLQQQQQQTARVPHQQQQTARVPHQQQQTAQVPHQQQQTAQVPHQQQQTPRVPHQQQQLPQSQPQQGAQGQQQQQAPQQQLQGAWAPRQVPQGQPQQVPWGPQSQQVSQSQPQQPVVWGSQQQQQIPQSQPQQQLQGVWGQRQQVSQGQPQQQAARGQPQQQVSQSQLKQQQQPGPSHQRQLKPSIGTGAAGDNQRARQVKVGDSDMHGQQESTSAGFPDVSKLTLTDPLHSAKIEKVKMSSSQIKLYHEMIPKRPKPYQAGTIGQKITVYTNLFQIIFKDNFVTNAVHYDVTIQPFKRESKKETGDSKVPKLPRTLCRKIFEQCREKHFDRRYPAYDGNKNAYSANDLPFDNDMRDIFLYKGDNQERQYEIIMKKVANIDLSWVKNLKPGFAGHRDQTAIQVLDIIMRHAPESRFDNVGRSLFWDINERESLGGGLALSRGGFMSGVLGWQPFLNVDISHKGFTMTQSVLDYISEVIRRDINDIEYRDVMRFKSKILSYLRGLKVTYEIPNLPRSKRTHRVIDLYEDSCESHKFLVMSDSGEEKSYTITKYFWDMKRYKIRRPDLPTLHVGRTTNGGKVLLPIELCTIVGRQAFNKKLDEMQTANMIKKAATDAFTRKQRIEDAFRQIDVNSSPVMSREFKLSVTSNMKQVDARILPAPELKYADSIAKVDKGTWRLQSFSQAKNLEERLWTIFNLSGNPTIESSLHQFEQMLRRTANEVGMRIGSAYTPFKHFRPDKLRENFDTYKDMKLIIVIIPDRTDVTYGNVKKISEMDVGVLTQCIKLKTIQRANPSTIKNILLKINSKLNGVNHTLKTLPSCLSSSPCMLVGADVTHPAPDSKDIPSIAAVAASRNSLAFQYNIALRLQPPKEEMILDLEAIILSQLIIYYKETGTSPKRIIYYRDGVSEGQLPQVMYYEINSIKNAIKKFNKGTIEVTCLVVQKRHHVRLFPSNPRETDDRNKNVRAGTIVDTQITHPDHIDFYLVSHASIQGTARPTKYRCICNDSRFSEDDLEQLTYYLCHMYARCTRSVSYPAPTYYAHLAAFRGRALLQGYRNVDLSNLEREQRQFTMKMTQSPMYFV